MRSEHIRISLVPLLVVTLLLASFLSPAPAAGGTGNENGETSPPPEQGRTNLVVGVAVVILAIGIIWWLTRGEKEPEEEKSDAVIEPAPKASSEIPAKEKMPARPSL